MYEDSVFIKTGISGKDMQRALVKYGILEQRMKEANEIRQKK